VQYNEATAIQQHLVIDATSSDMPAFARNSSQTTLLLAMHPLSCASELINLLYGTNPDLQGNTSK
ncbi:hypothetical protein TsFJ059_003401, partial [Trichoderma semiorbis]